MTLGRIRRTRRIGLIAAEARPAELEALPRTPRGVRLLETADPKLQEWMQVVSQERAQRALRIQERGIRGTLPELLTYDWLERRPHEFDFQSSLGGGRLILGGAVADFILFDLLPGALAVWRIQGDYWHSKAERMERDLAQRERLLSERYMGLPVEQVVDIWESAVYWRAPQVWEEAEVGAEMGRATPR
jgi:hypothetical protein